MSTPTNEETEMEFSTLYDGCRITICVPGELPFTIEKDQQKLYFDRNQINTLISQLEEASDWYDEHDS